MFKKSKIQMGSNRGFGVVFFVVFLIIAFWSFKGDFQQIKIIPLIISVSFLILGLLNSKFLTPLNMVWFKFGLLLGAIAGPIIRGFVFFLVVTPISFIMKITGKDMLKRKYDKLSKSYWIKREKKIGTMKQQF